MAATHGRLTGKPGVCLSTLGPGALNLTTGAAYALLGAMPMLMITGQKAIMSRRQARFQIVDIVATMTPLTKMARQIVSAGDDPDARARSVPRRAARSGPGPVHLELPEDIAARAAPTLALVPPHPIELPIAARAALDRAAAMILRRQAAAGHARRRGNRPRLAERCREFVRRTQHPVLQHADGQGRGAPAAPSSTWAPPRSPSATTCTTPSTAPT